MRFIPKKIFGHGIALALLMACAVLARAQVLPAPPPALIMDTDPVVHALCGKRVVLLGEAPIHGFGNTLEVKAQLIHRLVDQCHFNALFVESGLYDYLHIEHARSSGQAVSNAMIAAAIGGLWANQEVQALVPFLTEKVNAGTLSLGGLDDQIGAGTYASRNLSADLVQRLPEDQQQRCLAILDRHMLWRYTADTPYNPMDKQKIVGCLSDMQARLAADTNVGESTRENRAMLDSLQRNFARNFTEDDFTNPEQETKWFNDRDRSMYLNFTWLRARLPPHSKIIVWAATVHTAQNLSGVPGFEARVPLGSYIHREFKQGAYSLAFSALAGEYAFTHQPVRQLTEAPRSSLEARAFAHSNSFTVYLTRRQLRSYHLVAARPMGTDFQTARWDQVFDGLVVFRHERAPAWITTASLPPPP